jgi:hypothetical protein
VATQQTYRERMQPLFAHHPSGFRTHACNSEVRAVGIVPGLQKDFGCFGSGEEHIAPVVLDQELCLQQKENRFDVR